MFKSIFMKKKSDNLFASDRLKVLGEKMASCLGLDIEKAASIINSIYRDPLDWKKHVRKYGVLLSNQKETEIISSMMTGHTAQAQNMLIEELEKLFV